MTDEFPFDATPAETALHQRAHAYLAQQLHCCTCKLPDSPCTCGFTLSAMIGFHTEEVWNLRPILEEVGRAIAKFPTWPSDPLHALAVLGEEFGELTKAVLQSVYEPHKSTPQDVREEAIQTAAMALRFVSSLDAYAYRAGEQHQQERL